MARRTRIATPALMIALAWLAGCNLEDVTRPDTPKGDLYAIERSAAAAYDGGDWNQAAAAYKTLTERAPRVTESWFRLGNVYARLGRPAEAVAAYREAVLREPGMSKAWHNMGVVQLREAAATFAQMDQFAAANDPLRDRARSLLGGVAALLEGGDQTAAGSPPAAPPQAVPSPLEVVPATAADAMNSPADAAASVPETTGDSAGAAVGGDTGADAPPPAPAPDDPAVTAPGPAATTATGSTISDEVTTGGIVEDTGTTGAAEDDATTGDDADTGTDAPESGPAAATANSGMIEDEVTRNGENGGEP